MIYVLLTILGIDVVDFGVYDLREECAEAAQKSVEQYSASPYVKHVESICLDVKNHQVVEILSR